MKKKVRKAKALVPLVAVVQDVPVVDRVVNSGQGGRKPAAGGIKKVISHYRPTVQILYRRTASFVDAVSFLL